mgnify:CR=1 FL=1
MLFFEQFEELKSIIEERLQQTLIWEASAYNANNQHTSIIYSELDKVSIYNREDWRKTFQFFEKRIVLFFRIRLFSKQEFHQNFPDSVELVNDFAIRSKIFTVEELEVVSGGRIVIDQ